MLVLATVPVVAASLIALRLPRATVDAEPAEAAIGGLEPDEPEVHGAGRVRRTLRRGALTLGGLPFAVWAAAIVALYLNVMNGLLSSFYPLLGLSLGLSIAQIGTLSSLRSAVSSVARFGAGWLFARVPAYRLHLPLLATSAATLAVLPSIPGYLLQFPAFMLNGMSRGLLRVTTGAAAMDAMAGTQAGLAAAAMTAGLDLGKMIGPLIGGFVAGAFGLEDMFRIVPLSFLALYVVLYLVTPRDRLRAEPPTP
jgi:predicted MFS family arabinose efflux permease